MEVNMAEYPYTNKPEDISRLLRLLPTKEVPATKITADYFKSLGFYPGSGKHLLDILKILGFLDEKDEPSILWKDYVANERRGIILAVAIKKTYARLFEVSFCPYLEEDDAILDFLKSGVKASRKEMMFMLETFRALNELADFQDVMSDIGASKATLAEENIMPDVKVNPNLQLNIQIHIDPNTSDEKVETIFKNLHKYLLEKPAS
jgi:hypothetical protein